MVKVCCPEIIKSAGGSSCSVKTVATVGLKPPAVRSLFSVASIEGGRFGISFDADDRAIGDAVGLHVKPVVFFNVVDSFDKFAQIFRDKLL